MSEVELFDPSIDQRIRIEGESKIERVNSDERAGRISVEEAGRQRKSIQLDTWFLNKMDQLADKYVHMGEHFLAAAEDGDGRILQTMAAQGAPVNYHDPRNGATALHYTASQGARPALRALLKTGKCDFLARDNQGRLASELAGVFGRDLVMERLLLTKAIRQAGEQGVPLDRIYHRDVASRPPPSSVT
jgi:ankyrin repeat protein